MTSQTQYDAETIRSTIRTLSGWSDRDSETVKDLDLLLSTIVDDGFRGAIIPAFVRTPNLERVYYAVAKDDYEWRSLRPLLSAAVGVTYSDFLGITAEYSEGTDLERLIQSYGYTKICKFGAHGDPRLGRELASSLVRLVETIKRRPSTNLATIATTAQMLSSFDMALEYNDRTKCEDILKEISNEMRLDAMNIRFLRTRMRAKFGEWDQLVAEPFFQSLSASRRPQRITSDLVEAIYKSQLSLFERNDDPKGAVQLFRSDISETSGNLFSIIPGDPSPDVVKCFLIGELSQSSPDYDELNYLNSLSEK